MCEKEGCGNVNFARRNECNRCGEKKPGFDETRPDFKDHPIFKDGDWKCPMYVVASPQASLSTCCHRCLVLS